MSCFSLLQLLGITHLPLSTWWWFYSTEYVIILPLPSSPPSPPGQLPTFPLPTSISFYFYLSFLSFEGTLTFYWPIWPHPTAISLITINKRGHRDTRDRDPFLPLCFTSTLCSFLLQFSLSNHRCPFLNSAFIPLPLADLEFHFVLVSFLKLIGTHKTFKWLDQAKLTCFHVWLSLVFIVE